MNTPPAGVPDSPFAAEAVASVLHNSLVTELEGVARDRAEATPDIEFPDAAETCYQWKCEELHHHFRPREADNYRMAIDQREYWELEYLHYLDALQKRLLHKARDGVDGEPTADHWRSLASLCKNLLRHSGLSAMQIREVRQSIDSQEYWKLEAELFERRVAIQEDEMREALLQRDGLAQQRRTQPRRTSAASTNEDQQKTASQAGQGLAQTPVQGSRNACYLGAGEHIFDPQGWILGSHADSDQCDLQIAENNQTGISRRLLRVDISPSTHKPRVTVLSDRKIRIRHGNRVLVCQSGQPVEFSHPVTVDLGAVSFRAWSPNRTASQAREYKRLAKAFSEQMMRAMPRYIPSITSQPETVTHNIRYGKDGAVYVNEWAGTGNKGSHASVIMVKERVTGKIFGAKEPYYRSSDDHDAARKRFELLRMEFEHIMQLSHPHIVKAYDLVLAEDTTLPPWMIVEYIPLNLLEVLPDLEEHQSLTVLTHLCSALHHMHASGMTHRDVKPDNVLIQKRGQSLTAKLADFGTSKRNDGAKMDTFTGTEIYMAPELFNRPRCYADKVDIWSLGLIAMQLFTSWSPASDDEWDANDFAPWMRNVILANIAESPRQFHPLLYGLLRKKPASRWSAWRCLKWLWKHTKVDDSFSVDEPSGTGNKEVLHPRKRSASEVDRDGSEAEDVERCRRSPNPSVSTARAHALLSPLHDAGGDACPDMLAPEMGMPAMSSAAPTPRPDDEVSDGGRVEDDEGSSDGTDTELENDWKEDDY